MWGAARVSAPQQIIMQSPSEPEFLRTADDLITQESAEQEIYADVRLRAAYTRYMIHKGRGSHRRNLKHCIIRGRMRSENERFILTLPPLTSHPFMPQGVKIHLQSLRMQNSRFLL